MALNSWGLLADLVGVLMVGFFSTRFAQTRETITIEEGKPLVERIGWALIVLGFLLQLIASILN